MARNLRLRRKVATATRVLHGRAGLPRSGDAHAVQVHAGGRARVPRAEPARVPGSSTRCRSRRSSSSRSSWSPAWRSISSSPAAIATRTCAPTASRSSRRLTSRCVSSSARTSTRSIEGLLKRVWKAALNVDVPTPFPRLTFEEAMNRYGIDKPDTRFGMELVDFTEEFRGSSFKVFSGAVANGGVVKALNAKGLACATQGQIETMTEMRQELRREGPGLHQGRRRRMEIAHREVFQRRREGRADEQARHRGRRLDSVRRRPVAERVRNPRQDPPLLRRRAQAAGQADDSRRTGSISSGWWISRC